MKSENSRSPEREEQRRRSVGAGNLNLGSNRNAGRVHESESAPENPMRYTKDQTVRRHEQATFEGKGEAGKREVTRNSSATLGRHISSSKSGADVSMERADLVKSTRAKREKENFGD